MIINMTGGGGGAGATLVVTGVVGSICTVSKDTKTYTKTFGTDAKATFKGLTTGTWTVTMTNGSQTTTRNVTITTDYSITIAYFTATIAVTWPVGSTCTCTNGSTVLTAPDTSGSYTFTVPNTGEWTVSCTDGNKTKSASVSITTEGQMESVTLTYELYLFSEIDGNVGDWVADNAVTITSTYMTIDDAGDSRAHTRDKVDLSEYNTLYIDAQKIAGGAWTQAYIAPSDTASLNSETGVNFGALATRTTVKLDISSYNGSFYVCILGHWTTCKIFNIWLGFETEVLKEAI